MKNIKNHLMLALSVAFCASVQVFAMEKESEGIANTSGEWTEAVGNSSSESGTSNPLEIMQRLTKNIKMLKIMKQDIEDKKFQEDIQATISIMENMLAGRTLINMQLIKDKMKLAHISYSVYLK